MLKMNLEDVNKLAKLGEEYRELENKTQNIIKFIDNIIKSVSIDNIKFSYGVNPFLPKELMPKPKEILKPILKKANEVVENLLEEKIKLETMGVILEDCKICYQMGDGDESVFDKMEQLNKWAKEKLGDDE